ncbi:hypothetical protein CAPTEDRAFT_150995 [Capitella teleta]|uniref:Endoplasmic reticulum junction formation protein lunapark n=1 Tax=Capitella teleta TaxID=283909 RepID=R7U9E9_CAPTE|nr:hypothetical protein CAPTEDRAFT_150995 [Capitella teleta]|eukprot:ELU00413.1 hypothetical protein CAPTEDRAFT_150995 [Capitella teleta]
MYLPEAWSDRVVYSSPLLAFPLLVWLIKKLLHWYFARQITKNDSSLENAKERRKTILDEVMDKETYKKAKEILEKFDPDSLKSIQDQSSKNKQLQAGENQDLRQRKNVDSTPSAMTSVANRSMVTPGGTPMRLPMAPGRPMGNGHPGTPLFSHSSIITRMYLRFRCLIAGPPGPPMPRSVLPRDRSIVDRLVEGLVGDGPQNRYALICKECCSHNGMALKEEFEYISFRCCYCYRMNSARKIRANAPRLDLTPAITRRNPPEKSSRNPDPRTQVNGNQQGTPAVGNPRQIEEISAENKHAIAEVSSEEENFVDPVEKPNNEKKSD